MIKQGLAVVNPDGTPKWREWRYRPMDLIEFEGMKLPIKIPALDLAEEHIFGAMPGGLKACALSGHRQNGVIGIAYRGSYPQP